MKKLSCIEIFQNKAKFVLIHMYNVYILTRSYNENTLSISSFVSFVAP